MEEYVSDTLKELGISANLLGYGYLKTAITLLACRNEAMSGNFGITSIYVKIGAEYKVSSQSVERCIRHAIGIGANRGNPELWLKLFKHSYDRNCFGDKPTNKEFIATLAEDVRMRCKNTSR